MAHRSRISSLSLILPVGVLTAGALLEIWSRPLEGSKPLLVVLALTYSLSLLAARRFPLPAAATSLITIGVMAIVAPEATNEAGAPMFAGLGASFLVARYASSDRARAGLCLAAGVLLLVARDQPSFASAAVTFAISGALVGVAWGIGRSLRRRDGDAIEAEKRALTAEAERESAARLAVAEERTRIARELHDIVAHAVSKMVLRSGAVRHNLPDELAEDKAALQDVERAGREALTEMRGLLGAMRSSDEPADLNPQPDLSGLPMLVEEIRQSGISIALDVQGQPRPLPPALELSAFRIVQEGLTNTLKHAQAKHVQVSVTYGDDDLLIEVRDDGSGGGFDNGLGHGLVGIRERVLVFGGDMSACQQPDGGFLLKSRMPVRPVAA